MKTVPRLRLRARRLAVEVRDWPETRFRTVTARQRCLPDFLIIGAQKAGTTSLHSYLLEHPDVVPAMRKELHYFSQGYTDEITYRRYFPRLSELRRDDGDCAVVTGEATPYYLFHPHVPERATAVLGPDTRYVALLREPVSRAFSGWRMERRRQVEELDFFDALKAEDERVASIEATGVGFDGWDRDYMRWTYRRRGLYAEQLKRWYRHIDREQLLVVRSEDLFAHPQMVYDRVCRHLGLKRHLLADPRPRNQGDAGRIPPDAAAWLAERFEEPNRELAAMTGVAWP